VANDDSGRKGMDRRTLIKASAAAGAAAWSAPMIIDSLASPAAAGSAPCYLFYRTIFNGGPAFVLEGSMTCAPSGYPTTNCNTSGTGTVVVNTTSTITATESASGSPTTNTVTITITGGTCKIVAYGANCATSNASHIHCLCGSGLNLTSLTVGSCSATSGFLTTCGGSADAGGAYNLYAVRLVITC